MRRLWAGVAAVGLLVLWTTPAHADSVRDSEWMVDALKLPEAHKIATGEGVTVGIVDTGVDSTHPDLTGVVVAGKDSWSPKGDGQTDPVGHGTAMASLVAGHGHGVDGSEGVLGVAPGARVLSYGAWRPGDEKYDNDELAKGIRWVIDNGADVILLAYGNGNSFPGEEDLVNEALTKGVPVIAPTGNLTAGEIGVGFPGFFDGVTLVGCSGPDGKYSEVSLPSIKLAVAAPCEGLTSAAQNGGYEDISGTSKSAAVIAGTYALVRSYWPDISLQDLHRRILWTADGKGKEGTDDQVGHGVVQPVEALKADVEPVNTENPPHNLNDPIYQSSAATPSSAASAKSSSTLLVIGGITAAVLAGTILMIILSRRRT